MILIIKYKILRGVRITDSIKILRNLLTILTYVNLTWTSPQGITPSFISRDRARLLTARHMIHSNVLHVTRFSLLTKEMNT